MRAKRLDHHAWTSLYYRYFPKLYRYLFYRLRVRELAEDLAAQVFVEALARIKDVEDRGLPLSAWLYGIARNLSASQVRKARQRQRDSGLMSQNHQADPAQTVEDKLALEELYQALEHLTDDQRQVVALRILEGLPVAVVAQMLGKSNGAVRVLQFRALAALRDVLAHEQGAWWRGNGR